MELFLDPGLRAPRLRVARRLIARKLGFRNLLDVTPLAPTALVKGSHGLVTGGLDSPLMISSEPALLPEGEVSAMGFKQLVLDHVFA